MKRTIVCVAASVLGAAALPPAHAGEAALNPYSLRAGGSAATDDTNSTFGFIVGVSRRLGPGRLDIDYSRETYKRTRAMATGASYLYLVPFGAAGKYYAGIGVGAYYADVKTSAGPARLDDDGFSLAAKAVAGINIDPRWFVELGFTKLRSMATVDPSHASLVVGLRF